METDTFEKAFSDYLESPEYDAAEDALFSAIRAAFLAGWKAACGDTPEPVKNIVYLLHKKHTDP